MARKRRETRLPGYGVEGRLASMLLVLGVAGLGVAMQILVLVAQNSLTPALVHQLPANVKDAVIGSRNESLRPVFLCMVPLMIVGLVLLLFVKEEPLALTNETSGAEIASPAPGES